MADLLDRFPLFPLGLVLLPGEVVPLHIFEERYKLMIGECLENDTDFGIVWLSDDGLKEVGCTASVTRVIDQLDDGRMNILIEGSSPFRLLRRIDDLPYPAGDVELLHDGEEAAADGGDEARRRYAELVERVTDERPDTDDLAGLDAYGMAATLDFDPDAKQDLLELRSEEHRMERLSELFTATIAGLERAEVAAERARSNGRMGH
jgi:Lon protease-like protein